MECGQGICGAYFEEFDKQEEAARAVDMEALHTRATLT